MSRKVVPKMLFSNIYCTLGVHCKKKHLLNLWEKKKKLAAVVTRVFLLKIR